MRRSSQILCAVVALFAVGCLERELRPVNPCTTSRVERRINPQNVDTVDVLFMVDNSGSMREEQALLREEIPRMIRVLASGNRDDDPELEFNAVRSMHVGVITSDMGAGSPPSPTDVPTCDPGFGDDGIMVNTATASDCDTTFPSRVFAFEREGGNPDAFGAEIGCVADLGTGGCGFEQQLEATLKALSPASPTDFVASDYLAPTFAGGTSGHGGPGGANEGFLRPDSALAIVLLTDEEDCSVPNYDLFYSNTHEGRANPLNLRCSRFPGELYGVERYIEGLAQLRESRSLLVYAAIVGIPGDLAGSTVEAYDAMLADARLDEIEVDTSALTPGPDSLAPSCDTENGFAYPPRRIVEVARGLEELGASTTVQSICAASFAPAIDVIIDRLIDALGGACLPRPLNQNADGTVACEVYELFPPGLRCADADLDFVATERGMSATGEVTTERELCLVPQITPTLGAARSARGWYYDDASEDAARNCAGNLTPQRVAFSLLDPPPGAEVRLNCTQAILPPSEGEAQLGSFCTPHTTGAGNVCPLGVVPSMSTEHNFSCDPVTRACGVACLSDADCSGAGLLSYVCDDRTVLDAIGGESSDVPDFDGDGDVDDADGAATYGFCVNPTC